MKTIKLLITAIFCFASWGLFACSCFGPDTFCESLFDFDGNFNESQIIVDAVVSEQTDEGMNISINKVLNGDFEAETAFVNMGFGADCNHNTSGFSVGDNYLFILSKHFNDEDYALFICHVSFIKIENGILKGPIKDELDEMPYDEIGRVGSCGENLRLFSLNNALALFPNPTFNEINLINIGASGTDDLLEICVFDMLGREVGCIQKEDGLENGEKWLINVADFSAGVYFLNVTSKLEEVTFKIVKQ